MPNNPNNIVHYNLHGINLLSYTALQKLQQHSNRIDLYTCTKWNEIASNLDSRRFLFYILFCTLMFWFIVIFHCLPFAPISSLSSFPFVWIVINWKKQTQNMIVQVYFALSPWPSKANGDSTFRCAISGGCDSLWLLDFLYFQFHLCSNFNTVLWYFHHISKHNYNRVPYFKKNT